MKVLSLLLLFCALVASAAQTIALNHHTTETSYGHVIRSKVSRPNRSISVRRAKKAHVSREAALSFLRREGILYKGTQVLSAEWGADTQKWLIIVKYPKGTISHWFVDAAAKDYSGGSCMR